jgi:ribonucleoside-diphosphate reductase alpha chain
MYLETRDIDEYMKIYSEAWKRGLKTTYYLHVKPRHQSEQTTVQSKNVDKIRTESATRVSGFGFAKRKGK